MADFIFGITPGDYDYDIETYPNVFTCCIHRGDQRWEFELSEWKNNLADFRLFLDVLAANNCRMTGFNNIGFDYPVIHFIYQNPYVTNEGIYNKAMEIINSHGPAKFSHLIKPWEHVVEQLDLYKIYHFDNKAKATSLKVMEFNMGMSNIQDLPFPVGQDLTPYQITTLLDYNHHDVNATGMFRGRAKHAIELREKLSEKFKKNMMNMSDVKIGETLLVLGLRERGINCYTDDGQKKQTIRDSVRLADVIFPYVKFERQEFDNILKYFRSKTITETKGVFNGLVANVDGIDYKFGTGGIHASLDDTIVSSSDTHQVVDVDVASYYPNLGIQNHLYPEHLGLEFCDAYLDMYETRKTYPKKSPENGAYKLALNGSYGGSNNKYSPFFDSKYTMSITINGQLLLCMLVEQLIKIPGLLMIQANTDGVTYLCPREYLDHTRNLCRWWESVTNLELEEALYDHMFIRDVNSYIAVKQGGGVKRIGAYAYVTAEQDPGTREMPYHKDWSARVVPLAAEAALVRGEDIEEFIRGHDNVMDFMLRTKVPRSMRLEWGGKEVQRVTRYYVSTDGDYLEKVMPPKGPEGEYKRANKLTDYYFDTVMGEIGPGVWDERIHTKNQSKYETRRTEFHAGNTVMLCNDIRGRTFDDIDYGWYIAETRKLVDCLVPL